MTEINNDLSNFDNISEWTLGNVAHITIVTDLRESLVSFLFTDECSLSDITTEILRGSNIL